MDRYTKTVLTVIAGCLLVLVGAQKWTSRQRLRKRCATRGAICGSQLDSDLRELLDGTG
jgi:hypothetical protein